jgi:hypothetical protein
MFELFVIGGIAFWIFTAAIILCILGAVYGDRPFISLFFIALYLSGTYGLGNAAEWSIAPSIFYLGIPGYILIGVIWSILKWVMYVNNEISKYKNKDLAFYGPNGLKRLRGEIKVRNHRTSIITWMCYWPWSMIIALIEEPWKRIYNSISSMLQKISDHLYNKSGIGDEDPIEEAKRIIESLAEEFPFIQEVKVKDGEEIIEVHTTHDSDQIPQEVHGFKIEVIVIKK